MMSRNRIRLKSDNGGFRAGWIVLYAALVLVVFALNGCRSHRDQDNPNRRHDPNATCAAVRRENLGQNCRARR